jgi:hypothetical protein
MRHGFFARAVTTVPAYSINVGITPIAAALVTGPRMSLGPVNLKS